MTQDNNPACLLKPYKSNFYSFLDPCLTFLPRTRAQLVTIPCLIWICSWGPCLPQDWPSGVRCQEQASRGQVTFDQQDFLPGYLSPWARGCRQIQPTSRVPETSARPESYLEPSRDYKVGKGKYLCALLELLEDRTWFSFISIPHSHLLPVPALGLVHCQWSGSKDWSERLWGPCLSPFLACHQKRDWDQLRLLPHLPIPTSCSRLQPHQLVPWMCAKLFHCRAFVHAVPSTQGPPPTRSAQWTPTNPSFL